MLIFTHREVQNRADESAFTARFEPGSERLACADVQRGQPGHWSVFDLHPDVDEASAVPLLMNRLAGPRPVLVYLHGNNNTPSSCFERSAVFESLYDVEVIGFSWASEGYLPDGNQGRGTQADTSGDSTNLKVVIEENRRTSGIQDIILRYKQAKLNAESSIDALARFLRLLGAASADAGRQPFSLAVHSLGAHYLRNTLAIPGNDEAMRTATNVALLAPCAKAAGHREWLKKLAPGGQVFVTFNNADSVLAGARIADSDEVKLGAEPGGDLFESSAMRYIDFTGASNDLLGHDYFVKGGLSGRKKEVLRRIFSSETDIRAGELPRKVYPLGCDERRLTCFMAAPRPIDGGGGG